MMLHLMTLERLFMALYSILLTCSMILYCANINFYRKISNAKNLLFLNEQEVWIIQQSAFLRQISYAVHSQPNISVMITTRRHRVGALSYGLVWQERRRDEKGQD